MPTARKRTEKEIWRTPPSLNKWWVEVSNLGRVRSLEHKIEFKRLGKIQSRIEKGQIRKLPKDSRGRYQLLFNKNRGYLLHRLVAECFVENPEPSRFNFVFFKNGDKSDCRAENLQWGDGLDWAYRNSVRIANLCIELYDGDVKCGEFIGIGETARELGVSKQAVHTAMRHGTLCRGFRIVGKPRESKDVIRSIDEGREKRNKTFSFIDFPDRCFENQETDITPKAVFG